MLHFIHKIRNPQGHNLTDIPVCKRQIILFWDELFPHRLHTAAMEFGSQQSLNLRKTVAVEQCICPAGYQGLSCESCKYGFTRRNNSLYDGECLRCNCHGHAATCDPFTLRCGVSNYLFNISAQIRYLLFLDFFRAVNIIRRVKIVKNVHLASMEIH